MNLAVPPLSPAPLGAPRQLPPPSREHLSDVAVRLLKAMAHRERLAILCLLLDGEMCVRDLERGVGMRQAALSQQLSRLRAENIVDASRQGRFMIYRLKTPQVQTVVRALCKELGA